MFHRKEMCSAGVSLTFHPPIHPLNVYLGQDLGGSEAGRVASSPSLISQIILDFTSADARVKILEIRGEEDQRRDNDFLRPTAPIQILNIKCDFGF